VSRRYCATCFKPLDQDQHLYCTGCRADFRHNVEKIPELLRELNVTLSKQDRIGTTSEGSRPKGHEKPLIYKHHASEARDKLVAGGVVKWARLIRIAFPLELSVNMPNDPVQRLVAYVDRAAHHPWFGDMAAEISRLVAMAESTIDLAQQRLEAGKCDECGTRISGSIDSPTVTCPGCGVVYQIEERQQELFAAAQAHKVTAAQAEVYLGFFLRLTELRRSEGLPSVLGPLADQPFSGSLVRQWARRERFREVGRYVQPGVTSPEGWPLYRFGDVIQVALDAIGKANEGKRNAEIRRAAKAAARQARQLGRGVDVVTAA
jgi:hypothetical protein